MAAVNTSFGRTHPQRSLLPGHRLRFARRPTRPASVLTTNAVTPEITRIAAAPRTASKIPRTVMITAIAASRTRQATSRANAGRSR